MSQFSWPWYHGRLPRVQTDSILNGKTPGTYLVRDSSSIPGDFVLSVSESGKVSHYIINNKGSNYQIGDQTFTDIPSIIDFYKKHFLDTTTLKEPVPKPDEFSQKVKALYTFPGKDREDLPFKKGDILTIISKEEDNWWRARDSTGKEGMIPKPYVQVVSGIPGPPLPSVHPNPSRVLIPSSQSRAQSADYSNPPSAPSIQLPQVPNDGFEYVVATMDRVVPYDKTQLTFKKGDIIKVIKKHEDGSWFGELDNKTGNFPFIYCQVIQQGDEWNGV